jgi:hypothetical protein
VAAECLRECSGSINSVSEMSPADFPCFQAMSGGGLGMYLASFRMSGAFPACLGSIQHIF